MESVSSDLKYKLQTLHGMTNLDEGVVAYIQDCEDIYGQVINPVTHLVVKSHDEADLLQYITLVNWEIPPAPVAP